jgi:hypothetical protein
LISKKSSPLKPLSQMNWNLVGSIYARSFIEIGQTFHTCFLPNFSSFGKAVSEEKIFLEINQSENGMACGGLVC